MYSKTAIFLFLTTKLVFCNYDIAEKQDHQISKRALLFPQYSIWQFTYGVSAPAILPNRSINLSMACQLNYEFPWNYSHWFPTVYWSRGLASTFSSFDLDRHTFYKHIMAYLDGFGLEGEACLLRAICELSETPLEIERSNTLLEKILHYIFTPSEDLSKSIALPDLTLSSAKTFSEKLLLAETIGKTKGNCHKVFKNCELSIVDLITAKYNIF